MTAPDQKRVGEIAAGLDRAETQAMRGRIVHIVSRVQDRLFAKGILERAKDHHIRWSALGLAVRAHILAGERP